MKENRLVGAAVRAVFVAALVLLCAGSLMAADRKGAAQLAKDINAVKSGSAKASGGTVTLSKGVRLETALKVPADVTLELTKETLQLGNGATLTVDGTVNAKAGGITIDSAAASPATINGSGTIQLKSKGRLFGIIWEGKKLILDGVTLVGLPDNDKPVVEMGNGGEFVMKSGAITGNTRVSNEWSSGGGVGVWEYGLFTMQGGTISGNRAQGGKGGGGGGVAVYMGTFTMSGGTISGNTAEGGTDGSNGGGVNVESGEFIMSGGTISGNTVTGGGGGVRLEAGAIFTMSGGTIYGKADSLPAGTDPSLANSAGRDVSLWVEQDVSAKWGMGGTYTKGGASQSGGRDIGSTSDTLIAAPGR